MMENITRRSPVHTELEKLKPVWVSVGGMLAALSFEERRADLIAVSQLGLADLSSLPKLVVKGPGAVEWLEGQGIVSPTEVFATGPLPGGGLVIRTDRQEVFLEDGVYGQTVASVEQLLPSDDPSIARVIRQDASFFLGGEKAHDVFSQTCGFNFRNGPVGVVMTQVAGVSCWVLEVNLLGIRGYRLWLDPSYAAYLWAELSEIVVEFSGNWLGLGSLYRDFSQ